MTDIIETLPTVAGTSTALLAGPSQNVDYIKWIVDGVVHTVTPTMTIPAPYAFPFDTTTCSNDYHVIQPVSYRSSQRAFNPTSVSGLVCWIDFSDTTHLWHDSGKTVPITNNATLAVASDKAGVFADFIASVGPVWLANQFNGLGCASFTVSTFNQLLLSNGSSGLFSGSTNGDVFIVAKTPNTATFMAASSTANNNNVMTFGVQNVGTTPHILDMQTAGTWGATTRTIRGDAVPVSALSVLNFRNVTGPGSYPFYLNGTFNAGSGTSNDGSKWYKDLSGTFGSTLNVTIGGYSFGTTPTQDVDTCQICEVLIFSSVLGSTDRANVEAYLAAKWLPTYSNTAWNDSVIPTQTSAFFPSTLYSGSITYTAVPETPYAISVDNPTGLTMPTIQRHFDHISVGHLLYPPITTLNSTDQALCASSIDFINASQPSMATQIKTASPTTSTALYVNFDFMDYPNILDWLTYARQNSLDKELAFWHAQSGGVTVTGANWDGGFPVHWFWDLQKATAAGALTAQYTSSGGQLSTANPTTGLGGTWGSDGTGVTFSSTQNDYMMMAYPDKFSEIVMVLSRTSSSFTWVLEYPTATHTDGTPSAWAAFGTVTDGTSNGTASGTISFDSHTNTDWVPCVAVAGGSGFIGGPIAATAPITAYYVRLRTSSSGGTSPIASTLRTTDYLAQGTSANGKVPYWDATKDGDNDGFLNNSEYSSAGSPKASNNEPLRWKYQSRIYTAEAGSQALFTNYTDSAVKTYVKQWGLAASTANPGLYDALFLDNSSLSGVSGSLEDSSNYAQDYGGALNQLWRAMGTSSLGQMFLVPNMGGDTVTPLQNSIPIAWRESMVTENDGYSRTKTHLNTIATVATQFSPPPIQMLDFYYQFGTNGNNGTDGSGTAPNDRVRMLFLAGYYILATPQTMFMPFTDNFGTANASDNFVPDRWITAISTDVGQPTEGPQQTAPVAQGSFNYVFFSRLYDNALVIYRPLNDNGTGSVSTDSSSATNATFSIPNGNWYPLNADGTRGSVITATGGTGTVTMAAQTGMILMTSP